MYVMLLLGTVISAVIFGVMLEDFSPGRLIQVIQGSAIATLVLNTVALWKQETRQPPRNTGAVAAPATPSFQAAWRRFISGDHAIRRLTAIALGTMAFTMQDVLLEPYGGQVLGMSVAENVSLSSLDRATRLGLVSRRLERARATAAVARLAIKTPSTAQPVGTLSGGNQQKVVLAKGLACDPRVLLLDEPTRGIDIGAKREIYTLIDELARGGMAILVASSELPEILGISDRILVLAEGRVTAEFRRGAATEQTLLHAAIPTQRGAAVA
jgi:ABC-type dipeptide/oligopeptide/nickel transport system ATPase component